MPENDVVPDRGDAEFVDAVKRLMAWRHAVLRHPEDAISRATVKRYTGDYLSGDLLVLRCFDNPLWHQIEEALNKNPAGVTQRGSLVERENDMAGNRVKAQVSRADTASQVV